MKKKNFGAGKAFDDFGRPTSFWTGVIAYQWNAGRQAFDVCTVQVLGTGTVTNSRSYEVSYDTCGEVDELLDYFKELENHYKRTFMG